MSKMNGTSPHPERVLFFDIETAPNLAHVWSKFVDGSVIAIEREWSIICVAWQWDDEKRPHVASLRGRKDPHNDTPLVDILWRLFNEASTVIAHNGDRFDIKKCQARFLIKNKPPPSPFRSIDTLKICRRHFALTSNKLTDVCDLLFGEGKAETGGWKLWADCLAGEDKAWAKMEKYNKQDVKILRQLFHYIKPWMSGGRPMHTVGCPTCGSKKTQKRGTERAMQLTYQRYQCRDCGGWFRGKKAIEKPKPEFTREVRR